MIYHLPWLLWRYCIIAKHKIQPTKCSQMQRKKRKKKKPESKRIREKWNYSDSMTYRKRRPNSLENKNEILGSQGSSELEKSATGVTDGWILWSNPQTELFCLLPYKPKMNHQETILGLISAEICPFFWLSTPKFNDLLSRRLSW